MSFSEELEPQCTLKNSLSVEERPGTRTVCARRGAVPPNRGMHSRRHADGRAHLSSGVDLPLLCSSVDRLVSLFMRAEWVPVAVHILIEWLLCYSLWVDQGTKTSEVPALRASSNRTHCKGASRLINRMVLGVGGWKA